VLCIVLLLLLLYVVNLFIRNQMQIKMKEDSACKKLCEVQDLTPKEVKLFRDRIKEEYVVHWFVL